MRPSRLLTPLRPLQKPPVIFAPVPKTASNTLLKRLEYCLPVQGIKSKSGGGIGHFTIDRSILMQAWKSIPVRKIPLVYQHFLPTEHNHRALVETLNTGNIPKVVVSVRNIYDIAVSCAEHQEQTNGPWWIVRGDDAFLAPETKTLHSHMWNAVICLKFYTAWAIAAKSGAWDVKFITYENIVNNPVNSIETVAGFYGLHKLISPAAMEDIKDIKDNVNKGTGGRGETLAQEHKEMLQSFASCFQDIDFSPLGL